MSVTGTLTGGTFDDFLTAYIIAQFRTTGSQQTVQEAVSLNFTKIEYRNISLVNDNVQQVGFDSDPPSILSYSLAQLTADQAANEHTGLAPDEIDFFTPLDATVTRLPATLPLFATGLGALGLLGWRRKRKPKALSA